MCKCIESTYLNTIATVSTFRGCLQLLHQSLTSTTKREIDYVDQIRTIFLWSRTCCCFLLIFFLFREFVVCLACYYVVCLACYYVFGLSNIEYDSTVYLFTLVLDNKCPAHHSSSSYPCLTLIRATSAKSISFQFFFGCARACLCDWRRSRLKLN